MATIGGSFNALVVDAQRSSQAEEFSLERAAFRDNGLLVAAVREAHKICGQHGASTGVLLHALLLLRRRHKPPRLTRCASSVI